VTQPDLRIELAAPCHTQALRAFFERVAVACHCEWWHFQGDKNAWLDRLAHHPLENQRAQDARLERSDQTSGIVALDASGEVIGWMKLTPWDGVQKLYDQRPYRKLPCLADDRSGVLTVGCFLVAPEHRRRGIASNLLGRGIEHAIAIGARAIEAFPRVGRTLGDEEAWMGPLALFERFGFTVVGGSAAPYPVLRKWLPLGAESMKAV
jgi:GNAT superfamily N-acetyltransferase